MPLMQEALALAGVTPLVIQYNDTAFTGPDTSVVARDFDEFLSIGDLDFAWLMPEDEWNAISINYTSGTTGDPKGVVFHHRGAYLLAQGNALTTSMAKHAVYVWTLPMFHCNGWCFPWTLSAIVGTHVCLRQVRAEPIWDAVADEGVTDLCGAPIVMSLMISTPPEAKRSLDRTVQFFTAAAPSSKLSLSWPCRTTNGVKRRAPLLNLSWASMRMQTCCVRGAKNSWHLTKCPAGSSLCLSQEPRLARSRNSFCARKQERSHEAHPLHC